MGRFSKFHKHQKIAWRYADNIILYGTIDYIDMNGVLVVSRKHTHHGNAYYFVNRKNIINQ